MFCNALIPKPSVPFMLISDKNWKEEHHFYLKSSVPHWWFFFVTNEEKLLFVFKEEPAKIILSSVPLMNKNPLGLRMSALSNWFPNHQCLWYWYLTKTEKKKIIFLSKIISASHDKNPLFVFKEKPAKIVWSSVPLMTKNPLCLREKKI